MVTRKQTRIVRGGIIAIIGIVLAKCVVLPFYESERAVRAKIQLLELTHEKYRTILRQRDAVENKLHQLELERNRLHKELLDGPTAPLAAAEMQNTLETIARTYDLELKSVRILQPEKVSTYLSIPLEIRIVTDLKKVAQFLRSIELDNKLMTVSKLTIRGRTRRNPTLLIVRVVIRGFMQEGETDKERV